MDFAVPADHRVKSKEIEKKDKYLILARELKKPMKHESDGDAFCNQCVRYSYQRIATGTGGLGNKRTNRDNLNYSIIIICKNTEKSPGDLGRLVVSKTLVKDY